jgi:hypothetical protein
LEVFFVATGFGEFLRNSEMAAPVSVVADAALFNAAMACPGLGAPRFRACNNDVSASLSNGASAAAAAAGGVPDASVGALKKLLMEEVSAAKSTWGPATCFAAVGLEVWECVACVAWFAWFAWFCSWPDATLTEAKSKHNLVDNFILLRESGAA